MPDAFANSWGGSGDSALWVNTSFPSAQLIISAFFNGKKGIQAIVVLLIVLKGSWGKDTSQVQLGSGAEL